MKTCQCVEPIQVLEPYKIDPTKLTPDIHTPIKTSKSQVLTGKNAMIQINGQPIGYIKNVSIEYNARFECTKCKGRGWVPTTKDEKKLIGILE